MIENFIAGVILLVMSTFVFVMDFDLAGTLAHDRAASRHPTASAIITSSEVVSKGNNEEVGQFNVAYRYQVNDRNYFGDKFHHTMHAGGLQAVRAIQILYPVGSRVNIHYNPADPSDSVMTTGLRGEDLWRLMFLTAFNAFMVAGWRKFMRATRAARQREFRMGFQAPVTRLPGEGGEVRLRLAHARPVAVFLSALAGASVGMGFVVMMPFGGDVSVTQMVIAWVSVLGLAVALTVWQANRIAAGRYDFRVDRLRGTLTLPPGFDRETTNCSCSTAGTGEVALARIVDIRVASREETDSEGDRTTYYEPVIIQRDCVAAEATLAVTTQTTEEYAKEIVQALRREVGLMA